MSHTLSFSMVTRGLQNTHFFYKNIAYKNSKAENPWNLKVIQEKCKVEAFIKTESLCLFGNF